MILTLLTGMSAVATSLVFLGGAVYGTSSALGVVFTVVGGGWLGILHASLIRAATRGPVATGAES